MNKKGASDWTVRKIVVIILLLLILILLIVGLVSGKLIPLGENISAKINTILIMFGLRDDPGGFGDGDCTVSRTVSISTDKGKSLEGDFVICRSGICSVDFGNDIKCFYSTDTEEMSCPEIPVLTREKEKMSNHLFNDGLEKIFSLMGVDSYEFGLDEYMGGTEFYDLSNRKIQYVIEPYFGNPLLDGIDANLNYNRYTFGSGIWSIEEKSPESFTYDDVYVGALDEDEFKFGDAGFEFKEHVRWGDVEYFVYEDGDKVINDFDEFLREYGDLGFQYDSTECVAEGTPMLCVSGDGKKPASQTAAGFSDGKMTNQWELDRFGEALMFRLFRERIVVAPTKESIEALRSGVEGETVEIDGKEYTLGVEIGSGGFPVVSMVSGGDKYGLFYVGDRDPASYYDSGKEFDLRTEPLRLVKWKVGSSGNVGWYSDGEFRSYKLPKDEFDGYYFLNNLGSDNNLLKFFKEECR